MNALSPHHAAAPVDAADPAMILVLRLSGEAIGLPVSIVHEVIDPIPATRVPHAPAFAPWLINVRGAVVPLVDVRTRLRMQAAQTSSSARVVVLDVNLDGQSQRLAMIADAVEEVIDFDPTQLEMLPERGAPWPRHLVSGVLRRGPDLVLILQHDNLFRPDAGAATQH